MRKFVFLPMLFCARFLTAQTQAPAPTPVGSDQVSMAFREMERFSREAQEAKQAAARHTAERRAEQAARLQFWDKANKFVALWGDFASRLNENQTFDAKLAKKLSKAFHELEVSDGWPIRGETASGQRGEK